MILSGYTIVVGDNDNYLNKQTAEKIANFIKQKVGYTIPVVTDIKKEVKKEILIGKTNRKASSAETFSEWGYCAKVSDAKLVLNGGSAKAIEYGAMEAIKSIITGKKASFDNKLLMKGDYLKLAKEQTNVGIVERTMDLSHYSAFTSIGPAVYLVDDESFSKWGLTSGWDYDGRGAPADSAQSHGNRNSLQDVSTEEPTALTREFTKWNSGTMTLETAFTLKDKTDGFHYTVKNDKGETALHLFTKNGKAMIINGDAGETVLCDIYQSVLIKMKVQFDFNTKKYTIFLNDKNDGTFNFQNSCEYLNILELSTGITDTLSVVPLFTKLYTNYLVNERFLSCVETNPPKDFEVSLSKTAKSIVTKNMANADIPDSYSLKLTSLKDDKINLKKTFPAVNGKVVYELKFLFESRSDHVKIALNAGEKEAVAVKTKLLSLYSTDDNLISPYYSCNVWQTLRIEADTRTQKADIKLNGKQIAQVYFQYLASEFDSITISTETEGNLWIDDILVYQLQEIPDYVPEPVPSSSDDNIIGINICSLWRQGTHEGWDVVTPYDEIKPYLGYYEDGSPEVADWEIKWMAEHGIDFELYCWYASTPDSPMKTTHLSDALINGYFNAKYSDKVKFALLWEAANGQRPKSSADFRKNFVPYWMDYFLSDQRYMTIDNKPVIAVFGADKLIESLGGVSAVNKEFNYVRNICRELGFDGTIFLSCNGSQDPVSLQSTKEAGFDAVYAYNWGKSGFDPEYTKQVITAQQNTNTIQVVPTLSTGFNNVAWAGTRSENMSVSNFESMLNWIRDTALKRYTPNTWQSKFLMLSTWNEYGEGTYMMPSGLNGFGYLDSVRTAFTKNEAHTDITPTEQQKSRFDYLYPQNRTIIKPLGYEKEPIPTDVIYRWDFTKNEDAAQWKNIFGINDFSTSGGKLSGTGTANDFGIGTVSEKLSIDISNVSYVHIRMKNTLPSVGSSGAELFFTTGSDSTFSGEKRAEITVRADGNLNDYYFPVSANAKWNGKLQALRIDPLTVAGSFELTCVELLGNKNKKEIVIDGKKLETTFLPQLTKNGTLMLSLDPANNVFNLLTTAFKWDRGAKTIRIYNQKHDITFTMGSTVATLDGKTVSIGTPAYLFDGLPTVPLEFLVESFGYSITDSSNTVTITTK